MDYIRLDIYTESKRCKKIIESSNQEMKAEHTKRFKELMQRHELQNKYYYFTDEEIEYLGKEDLITFGEKYPNEARSYMLHYSKYD